MINLLPPENKREVRAARSNTLLIRYNLFLLGALAFLLLAIGVVYFYLTSTKSTAEKTISDNKAKVANYASVQTQAQAFRDDLSTAKQILGQQVDYSKVILEIAALMPHGTVLESLSLDSKTFGTQTPLIARAKTYEDAIALKDSFQKSPIFSNVQFQGLAGGGSDAAHPITVTIDVTIKKDAVK